MRNERDLLLENHEAKCFFCDLAHIICQVFYAVWMFFGLHEFIMYTSRQWTRAIDRSDSRDINKVVWLHSLTKVLGSCFCELKDAHPLAFVKHVLIHLRIIDVNPVWV